MPKKPSPEPPAPAGTEVPASEVKKAWHHFVDRVSQKRETIVVTRYGRPVARLTPLDAAAGPEGGASLVGGLRGTVTFHGDVVEPTGERWDADG